MDINESVNPTTTNGSGDGSNEEETDAFGFSLSGNNRSNTAKMVVDEKALFYKVDHQYRGKAVILNHELFDMTHLGKRSGTNADRDNLESCLKSLGFDVDVKDNLRAEEVLQVVDKYSQMDHSNFDCFFMCVLSHGEEGGIIFARDVGYKQENLWMPFAANNCTSLAGKPKLFFIQACQGSRLDPGIAMRTQTDSNRSYKIPVHADFLIAYSTLPGFYSWRNTSKGSWFIQALCNELRENVYKYDILTLLTFVNRRVATEFESYVPNNFKMHAQKQIPCISFMLTRLIKFQPKYETVQL